jgi:hypothetical protein
VTTVLVEARRRRQASVPGGDPAAEWTSKQCAAGPCRDRRQRRRETGRSRRLAALECKEFVIPALETGHHRRRSFQEYVGIDYSGAATSSSRLSGLRVFRGEGDADPVEVRPASGKHWTREGIATWIGEQLERGRPTVFGLDHGFSFPVEYFARHGLDLDWRDFLDDFQAHWPADGTDVRVEDIRRGRVGSAGARSGEATWRRLTERRAGAAKSVFHFDVPGSVAKSTHAGLPWIRQLLRRCPEHIHAWPFDGWDARPGRSMIAEVYPSLWRTLYPRRERTDDQHDAAVVALWLRDADRGGALHDFMHPRLSSEERDRACREGWILGVGRP